MTVCMSIFVAKIYLVSDQSKQLQVFIFHILLAWTKKLFWKPAEGEQNLGHVSYESFLVSPAFFPRHNTADGNNRRPLCLCHS